MTRRLWQVATAGSRVIAWVFLRILPPRRFAVVHGWPDNEGNAVEMVRALLRRYTGRQVVWLLDDAAYAGPAYAREELADRRVVRVRKGSLHALWLGLRAETTFFTHGLFTAVAPPDNRLVINLWHGDGPKATRDTRLVRSTVVVSGTRLWGAYKGRIFGLPPTSVAVVGNPRIDQFAEPIAPATLTKLGLRSDRHRVLWLPTYRQAKGPRSRAWADGTGLTDRDDVRSLATDMHGVAEGLSIELLIKPHPLDVDSYDDLGLQVVRGQQLDDEGVALYQLMGTCDALISDVSSAWVDYLSLDRPIAFYVPDLAQLKEQRGLNVDDLEGLLPGPLITSPGDARTFLEKVAAHDPEARPSAYRGLERIGAQTGAGAADRLLTWLADYQSLRGRPMLFVPPGEVQPATPARSRRRR